jgi:hypothetical protein
MVPPEGGDLAVRRSAGGRIATRLQDRQTGAAALVMDLDPDAVDAAVLEADESDCRGWLGSPFEFVITADRSE